MCVRVCCASFILMMYTDIHSVLFQFAFNQRRFMVIHELCCRSQSNPGSGPRRFTADRGCKLPTAVGKQNHPESPQILSSAVQGSGFSQLQFSPTKWSPPYLLVEEMYRLPIDCFERHLPMMIQYFYALCQSGRPNKRSLALKEPRLVAKELPEVDNYFGGK